MTEFKVGDELEYADERYRRTDKAKRVVTRVYTNFDDERVVGLRYYPDRNGAAYSIDTLSRDYALRTFRVRAPHAPPESFRQVFCAWTGQTVKPEPARTALQQARENTLSAVRRLMHGHATIGQIDRHIDHVICEAKVEAFAEYEAAEPKPYGRVVATAGATCHGYRREGDDVELTFKVRVPAHAAIACVPLHATNYRVTATSKGAV